MKTKLLCLFSAFVALPSLRAQDPTVLYGDWSERNAYSWTDGGGEEVPWTAGSVAHVKKQHNGNSGGGGFNVYGFIFDYSGCPGYWTDGNKSTVGAGGIEFLSDGTYAVGRNSYTDIRFELSASQCWKGPSSDGARANLSVGYPGYGDYWKMPVKLAAAVENLDISGRLNVWFSSPSNNFSGVEVKVAAPARLLLPCSNPNGGKIFDARLKAEKLVLCGEGSDTLPLGGSETYFSSASLKLDNLRSLDADHVAEVIELKDGADLHAASEVVYAVPTLRVIGGESVLDGNFVVTQSMTRVELSDGATLKIEGNFSERGVKAALSVAGSGRLVIDDDSCILSGGLNVGENIDLHVAGSGRLKTKVTGGKSLTVSAKGDELMYIPTSVLASMSGSEITVASGTVLFEKRSDEYTLIVGDGAKVVYGEDDALIVTDLVRTESVIELDGVNALKIYGSGLTSATSLKFSKGTNLVFKGEGVVSSPITIDVENGASAECVCDQGVRGGFAGKLSIPSKKGILLLSGPGTFVFSGGIDLGVEGSCKIVDDASVEFTGNKEYLVSGYGSLVLTYRKEPSDRTWGRYLAVKDGAHLKFKAAASQKRMQFQLAPANSGNYDSVSTLEVGEGGTVTFPHDGAVYIGGNQAVGSLIISGGTVNVGTNSYFCIGYGQYSTGYLHMNSGHLNLGSPFTVREPTDTGFVKWNGGTIAVAEGFTGESLITGKCSNNIEGSRRLAFEIAGACSFDLTHSPYTVFTNMTDTTNRGEWYGKGSLTVKGGKTLLMRSIPDNIALRVEGDATAVAIDDETRIFNYEECVKNVIWRRPYPVANAEYSSAGAQTNGLTLASFTVGGGCAGFANLSTGYEVAVPKAFVAAGGEWNNAFAVRGAGITLGDLDFAAGSTLYAGIAGRVTPTLALSGALTLPDGEMFLRTSASARPSGNSAIVFAAAGGISGEPRWKSLSGRRNVLIEGNLLKLAFPGMDIFVR
jgi:hypothetical protein